VPIIGTIAGGRVRLSLATRHGEQERPIHCTVIHGSASRDILAGLSVDKAFEGGEHAEKLMMSIAAKVILLFDASKMGRTSFALFAPLEAIDAIITDAIGAEDRARLVENGIDALVAG